MGTSDLNHAPSLSIDTEVSDAVNHGSRLIRLGLAGIIAAVLVIAIYVLRFLGAPISADTESWGQFGDYIGGLLNPTFSFLALLALLATFRLQVRELSISARELKNSSDALQQQNETLKRQAFEATFFQLLQLFNSIAESMRYDGRIEGRTLFRRKHIELLEYLIPRYHLFGTNDTDKDRQNEYSRITENVTTACEGCSQFFNRNMAELGHYYRTLEHILQFIDQTATTPSHPLYADLVGAQLSEAEARMLFYYCLTEACPPSLKQLVEKYGLLKAAARGLVPSEALYRLVSANAFGGAYPAGWVELGRER